MGNKRCRARSNGIELLPAAKTGRLLPGRVWQGLSGETRRVGEVLELFLPWSHGVERSSSLTLDSVCCGRLFAAAQTQIACQLVVERRCHAARFVFQGDIVEEVGVLFVTLFFCFRGEAVDQRRHFHQGEV